MLIRDNLNTHSEDRSMKLLSQLKLGGVLKNWKYIITLKHGSWLNMAEIEIGVLSWQRLPKYTASKEQMMTKVTTWGCECNGAKATADCQFTIAYARVKLKKLSPVT